MTSEAPSTTKTITLIRGWTDPQTGTVHRTVRVRTPLADDEIKAEGDVRQLMMGGGHGTYESLGEYTQSVYLLRRVIEQFGEIMGPPPISVLRALPRFDLNAISAAVNELEEAERKYGEALLKEADAAQEKAEAAGN